MTAMSKPNVTVVELSDDGRYGKIVMEPIERGYGITVGNALRRVLLSSLPGYAITSVAIDGVMHEFSTIEGVKEDVTEIVLNLKGVLLKIYDEDRKTLYVQAEGPCVLKAGDIKTDSSVEIINKDHVIATLAEGAKLDMILTADTGRGYVSADKNKQLFEENVLGRIAIDSLYSPVSKVNYTVDATRVGRELDWDKLTLDVWTDGTLTATEAASLGSRILIDRLNLFVDLTDTTSLPQETIEEEEVVETVENSDDSRWKSMSIEELELSVRSFNCLKRASINTVAELIGKTPEEMMKVRNLGRKSLEEVNEKLIDLGLSLKLDEN
ncbi:MAG: DNA-directed RNA polymerase subunit alpha [Candidatus Fimenecus sp.]